MYVCLCHALSDRQVRSLAVTAEGSAAALYRALGVRPRCGKCVPMVKEILQRPSDPAPGTGPSNLASDDRP